MKEKKKRLPMAKIKAALATHLRFGDRGRVHFKKSGDALDEALRLGLPLGQPIKLADGRTFEVQDQFAEKNVAFSAKMFQRFAVKEVKLPVRPASRAKEGGAA